MIENKWLYKQINHSCLKVAVSESDLFLKILWLWQKSFYCLIMHNVIDSLKFHEKKYLHC